MACFELYHTSLENGSSWKERMKVDQFPFLQQEMNNVAIDVIELFFFLAQF